MSCTNFQRTISLHKNVKYQSVILTIIEGDFQLVFENIELDTLPKNTDVDTIIPHYTSYLSVETLTINNG